MDQLKTPTSLIAGTNIIFSVGSFLYLHKRVEQMEKENESMKNDIKNLTLKLSKFANEDNQTEELLKDMDKKVKNLKKEFSKVGDLMIEEELSSIKEALENNDIDIKSPKHKKKPKNKYVSEESYESIESPKKKKLKKRNDLDDDDIINLLKQKRG